MQTQNNTDQKSLLISRLSSFKPLFSFKERMPREKFWIIVIIDLVFFVIFINGGIQITEKYPSTLYIIMITQIILSIPFVWVLLSSIVKRLHDLGNSGYIAILSFAPYINILLLIWLLLADGKVGSNQYGDDPLSEEQRSKRKKGSRIVLVIMIVIVIILCIVWFTQATNF